MILFATLVCFHKVFMPYQRIRHVIFCKHMSILVLDNLYNKDQPLICTLHTTRIFRLLHLFHFIALLYKFDYKINHQERKSMEQNEGGYFHFFHRTFRVFHNKVKHHQPLMLKSNYIISHGVLCHLLKIVFDFCFK